MIQVGLLNGYEYIAEYLNVRSDSESLNYGELKSEVMALKTKK